MTDMKAKVTFFSDKKFEITFEAMIEPSDFIRSCINGEFKHIPTSFIVKPNSVALINKEQK